MGKVKKYVIELMINISIVIIIFIMALLFSTIRVTSEFNPFSIEAIKEQLQSLDFWLLTGSLSILGIMGYSTAYYSRFISRMISDDTKKSISEYEAAVKNKDDNYESFKIYIKADNLENKKRLYYEYYEKKISTLENKIENIPLDMLHIGIINKRYKRLNAKLQKYKEKIEPENIDKNILRYKVKGYQPVYLNYFKKDFLNQNYERNKYVSHADAKYRLSLGPKGLNKIISSIIFAGITTLAGIEFQFGVEFFTILAGASFTILMSVISGIKFANKNFNSEIRDVLEDRTQYLQEFDKWCMKNDPTYFKKILDEAVNEEINRRIEEKQALINNKNKKENEM